MRLPATSVSVNADSPKAHLRPAHAWDCPAPACRAVNFAQAVPVELTESERAEMRNHVDLAENEEVEWTMAPSEVTCAACDVTYEVCMPDGAVPSVDELRRMLGGGPGSGALDV